MKTILSLVVVAVAALQLSRASVIRDRDDDYMKELGSKLLGSPMFPDELKHIFAPYGDPEAPEIPEIPEAPEVQPVDEPEVNKVVVQAEEHTDEEEEQHNAEVEEYDPSTDVGENFIVTPEEELSKLAEETEAEVESEVPADED